LKGKLRKEAGIFVLLIVLCTVVAFMNPRFLGADNLTNMARLIGLYGIFSIGVGLVIMTGGIDLSVGSLFALGGVFLSILLMEKKQPPILAVPLVIALGAALGWIHGLLITRAKLQPFIVTLCGLLFYRGMARFIAGDETKGFGNANGFEGLRDFTTKSVVGLPMPFIFLIVLSLIMGFVLHRSAYGRHIIATGCNENAARYSGIDTKRVITSVYIISGLLAGIAAILIAFYTNSISPSSHGNFYELYAIAAAVLGGCSLRGGEGSILGIVLGTVLLQVLQNLVNLLGIPSSLNFAVMGAVILIGVLADQLFSRKPAKS
jgi:ribose transport system permease protein